jgi:hypothetical protein
MKKYDYRGEFYNGIAPVKVGDKWGFINEHNEEICEIKYDYSLISRQGFMTVKLGDKWGEIDCNGKEFWD